MPPTEYILEFSDLQGDGLADEHLARFVSEIPLPLPNVKDRVRMDGKVLAEVVNREFSTYGSPGDVTLHVQVFCKRIGS